MREGVNSFIQQRPGIAPPLIGVIAFFVVSFLSAVAFLWHADWFGVGDLASLPVYSACFAPALFSVLAILVVRLKTNKSWLRLLIGVVAALILTYGLTICLMIFLGGWFYAISYPLFFCWLLGALASVLVAEVVRDRRLATTALVVFALGILGVIGLYQQANAPDPALLIVFRQGTTQEEINEFHHTYICVAEAGRDGCALANSINTYAASSFEGKAAAYISFWKDTPRQEIETFRGIILMSPIVYELVEPE